MNDYKFAFIICYNNETLLSECIVYLNLLSIPTGYDVDILTIKDAPYMTNGYNEGMHASDAKYKIYLHQDVFITNTFFLHNILSLFQTDSQIGMLGLVGYQKVSPTGFMWHEKRLGAAPLYGARHKYPDANFNTYRYQQEEGFEYVALIDGLLMATCVDLEWDETHLHHWDFYDVYQSIHFLESGYKIVVPNQTLPWFIHDDGHINNMINYAKYRSLFMEQHPKYLGKTESEIRKMNQ